MIHRTLSDVFWITKNGYYLNIKKMSDRHIQNCIKMLSKYDGKESREQIAIFEDELFHRNNRKDATEVELTINGELSQPHVILSLSRMPKNCTECPLRSAYTEDEPDWGSGTHEYCPYGGENWGSNVRRPRGCPLKIGK